MLLQLSETILFHIHHYTPHVNQYELKKALLHTSNLSLYCNLSKRGLVVVTQSSQFPTWLQFKLFRKQILTEIKSIESESFIVRGILLFWWSLQIFLKMYSKVNRSYILKALIPTFTCSRPHYSSASAAKKQCRMSRPQSPHSHLKSKLSIWKTGTETNNGN